MFDSIIDSIMGIDEADLFGAGAAAFTSLNGKKGSIDPGGTSAKMIDMGTKTEVAPYKSKATDSVDASSLEAEWLQRLNKFANISNTMAKPR